MTTEIASAPGKLMLSGEYAVIDGAPSLMVAMNRRAVARIQRGAARGSSAFLLAVAAEIAARRGDHDAAAKRALEIAVDSRGFYNGTQKLGLGSSAAVTVAATALALGEVSDLAEIHAIAAAAHARAQAPLGAKGSGADIAAAVYGGAIVFTAGKVAKRVWPSSVRLVPFFTGTSASTPALVAQVAAARVHMRSAVEAALLAISDASKAVCAALTAPPPLTTTALIGGIALAAAATDALALAAGVHLVPECVMAARAAMARLGGTAKTTGAGGGDIGVAVTPSTADVTEIMRALIQAGCKPLDLTVDETGVDLRPDAS